MGTNGGKRENSGRRAGGKNRATIERELIAARAIDEAKSSGKPLAKDVLQKLMEIAEGATGVNKPTTEGEILKGSAKNPDGDWGRFGEWFDRTAYVAKALAQYQSPTFKAVAVTMTPGESMQSTSARQIDAKVIDINDAKVVGGSYIRMVKSAAG